MRIPALALAALAAALTGCQHAQRSYMVAYVSTADSGAAQATRGRLRVRTSDDGVAWRDAGFPADVIAHRGVGAAADDSGIGRLVGWGEENLFRTSLRYGLGTNWEAGTGTHETATSTEPDSAPTIAALDSNAGTWLMARATSPATLGLDVYRPDGNTWTPVTLALPSPPRGRPAVASRGGNVLLAYLANGVAGGTPPIVLGTGTVSGLTFANPFSVPPRGGRENAYGPSSDLTSGNFFHVQDVCLANDGDRFWMAFVEGPADTLDQQVRFKLYSSDTGAVWDEEACWPKSREAGCTFLPQPRTEAERVEQEQRVYAVAGGDAQYLQCAARKVGDATEVLVLTVGPGGRRGFRIGPDADPLVVSPRTPQRTVVRLSDAAVDSAFDGTAGPLPFGMASVRAEAE